MVSLGLAFLIIAGLASTQATDYCREDICNAPGHIHIACGNNGEWYPDCLPDATHIELTKAHKDLLLKAHNEKRNYIAGGNDPNHDPACRMATMTWDDEMASIAALNVLQCDMRHDDCRNTDAFKYSGQSIAFLGYFEGDLILPQFLSTCVDMWYGEVKWSNMTYINAYPMNPHEVIGHYTVMVADKNIKMGCAAATFSVPGESWKKFLLTCNYATTNIINFPIYEACAAPGEKCVKGTNPCFPNLCHPCEKYEVNKLW